MIKLKGTTLPKLSCLSRCNGCITTMKYGSDVSVDEFREDVKRVCSQTDFSTGSE